MKGTNVQFHSLLTGEIVGVLAAVYKENTNIPISVSDLTTSLSRVYAFVLGMLVKCQC